MGLQDKETDGHGRVGLGQQLVLPAKQLRQGDKVPEGLAHLLSANSNHVVVHPIMHALGAAGGHILGNFALVVREHEVHAAAVNVEFLSQILGAHHRALQVPAREAVAPGGRPAHDVLRLRLFPKGKVVRGMFVSLAVQAAGPFQRSFQRTAAEYAVMVVPVVLAHIEIDGAVAFIGIAGFQDFLDGLDLLDDMAAGAGLDGGRLHVEQAHGLMVALRVVLHHLHGLQLLQAGLLGNLVLAFVGVVLQMAYIRDVTDIAHFVAQILEQAEQHIVRNPRTGMAQVGVPIHSGTAHIHAYPPLMDGLEQFFVPGKRIGKV